MLWHLKCADLRIKESQASLEHETIQMIPNVKNVRGSQGVVEFVGKVWLQVNITVAALCFKRYS